jgi:hypothetical protein
MGYLGGKAVFVARHLGVLPTDPPPPKPAGAPVRQASDLCRRDGGEHREPPTGLGGAEQHDADLDLVVVQV